MSKVKIQQAIWGISFAASVIGLLLIGLAFGESLSGGSSVFAHSLFTPGALCLGAGTLCQYILFLAKPAG